MATRQEIQIAQDIIKFINTMNDLLDCASWMLREKDPQTGGKLQFQVEENPPRDFTLEEIKENVKRIGQNVLGYWNMINGFKDKYGGINLKNAMLSLGVDVVDIQNDLASFDIEAKYLWQNIQNAQTKVELIPFADRIDTNVPKLTLVRRSWCL